MSVELKNNTNIKIEPPKMQKVIILNDDYTPTDLVVEILQKIFWKNLEEATQIMNTTHTSGKAICGVYSPEMAETKIKVAKDFAVAKESPLEIVSEED